MHTVHSNQEARIGESKRGHLAMPPTLKVLMVPIALGLEGSRRNIWAQLVHKSATGSGEVIVFWPAVCQPRVWNRLVIGVISSSTISFQSSYFNTIQVGSDQKTQLLNGRNLAY